MPLPPTLIASLPDVWQGPRLNRTLPVLPTGHPLLDRHLPSGGWPIGGLTELLTTTPGSGELSLLLPALADVTRRSQWVVLVDPPWIPYPPAIYGRGVALEQILVVRTKTEQESLWACEQALRGVRGGMVIAWQEQPAFSRLRRLQLATSAGRKAAFLFRSPGTAEQASPAPLRLQISADDKGTHITVLKCRGTRPSAPLTIRRTAQIPGLDTRFTAQTQNVPPLPARRENNPNLRNTHVH